MTIFGKQPILSLLESSPKRIKKIFVQKELDKKLFGLIRSKNIEVTRLDFKKAQAMAKGKNHQGILAEIEPIEFMPLKELKDLGSLVVLCGLNDVGNIGAIIRTTYALGFKGLVVSGIKSVNLEGLVRSSVGAAFYLPIGFEPNTLDLINTLKMDKFYLIGSDMKPSQTLDKTQKKLALFIGSEESGIPKGVLKKMDTVMSIQMHNNFNSLNASVATAILIDRINQWTA